jgi:phosphate starvation-inducible protein PhoH
VKGISKIEFDIQDIVRHKLVQQIVAAYDKVKKDKTIETERAPFTK